MEKAAPSDAELLAEWLGHQREPAFHALVARYAGLVHMAAKRTSGDETLATEASQLVFILLARKAKSLASRTSLAGWLHLTAVMQAKNLVRQNRREDHKRQRLLAVMATQAQSHSSDSWQEMQPVLDTALAALSAKDREALLLRFYRSLTIREIAAILGIATDAAQKRIDRATERLRGKLARRGCQAGGSLSAAMLTGFAADAQAATLPVSILASKAIAAGAVSSFSLSALIASLAALMKSTSLIPPFVALVVAGVWTGTKYQSLTATEARNGLLRAEIADARTFKPQAPVKLTKDDGPIDWQKLATESENGPEMQRFIKRLESMAREEMIAALDQIAALEISKKRRGALEWAVVNPLAQIDPEWVLNRFTDRLREDRNQQTLPLTQAFALWATRDLAQATAWFDAQIAAGNLNTKQLDQDSDWQPRHLFEAELIDVLLASDPAAAARRLVAFPENQRKSVLSRMCNKMTNRVRNEPLTEGNHLAFANLVRSQLPANLTTSILSDCLPYTWGTEEFPKFNAYMDVIEATPEERMVHAEDFSGNYIRMLSNKRKVTLDDLNLMRIQFAEISSQDVDAMTARSLAAAMVGRNGSMMFTQASALAVGLSKVSASDAVLATFLEISIFDEPDKKLGRELAGKVSDETRRAEILKRFK